MTEKKFVCPVCGFDGLAGPVVDEHDAPSYEVCPCCGFEPGFDEAESRDAFRNLWLKNGAPWFMPKLKPKDWDLKKQLSNLDKSS